MALQSVRWYLFPETGMPATQRGKTKAQKDCDGQISLKLATSSTDSQRRATAMYQCVAKRENKQQESGFKKGQPEITHPVEQEQLPVAELQVPCPLQQPLPVRTSHGPVALPTGQRAYSQPEPVRPGLHRHCPLLWQLPCPLQPRGQ